MSNIENQVTGVAATSAEDILYMGLAPGLCTDHSYDAGARILQMLKLKLREVI